MQEKPTKKKKQLNTYIRYSTLSSQMVAIIFVGIFFGDFLDKKYQTQTPVYTLALSLLSIFSALYYVLKKILNQNDKK